MPLTRLKGLEAMFHVKHFVRAQPDPDPKTIELKNDHPIWVRV